MAWWRHQMETFSVSLAICAGNSPVPGEFPTQRPVTRSFDVYFDLHPNERLSKQSWGWWYETLSWSLWRHCNDGVIHKCIRPLSSICIMKILCTWKKCLQVDTIILAFTKRVRCLIYNERICVLLKKGVFYWTSKSAISVEKRVFFYIQNQGNGSGFQTWVRACVYALVGSGGAGHRAQVLRPTQRTHDLTITSLGHQNGVATLVWRNNDVIIAWCVLQTSRRFGLCLVTHSKLSKNAVFKLTKWS